MQHRAETNAAVAILTGSADYFAMLKHILLNEGMKGILCDETDIECKLSLPCVVGLIIDVGDFGAAASTICQRIKSSPKTQNLDLLAIIPNGDTNAYMELMRAGADQCLIRPFWPPHLLSFLKGVNPDNSDRETRTQKASNVRLGEIELSSERKLAWVNGTEIILGPIEFKLLQHLLTDPGRIFSRDDLISAVWPEEVYVQRRTVDVHIGRIRRQLKKAMGTDIIRTARSSGYAIEMAGSSHDAA